MQTYLGIDAGGSGSRWALLTADGAMVSRGDDGLAIQVAEVGTHVAAGRVDELLQEVVRRQSTTIGNPIVVGLAGVAGGSARRELEAQLCTRERRVRVVEDTITAAAAALADGPGVAVFAGTGSFAVARGAEGRLRRVGGRGSIASDHGSGYRVVRNAAESALLAADGMGDSSTLGAALVEALGASSVESLGLALKTSSTREIARCFPAVLAAAAADDEPAARVLGGAAIELSRMARTVAARVGLELDSCTVTLGGGTMRAAVYFDRVEGVLRDDGFMGSIRALPMAPERGAARLARAVAGDEWPLCRWVED